MNFLKAKLDGTAAAPGLAIAGGKVGLKDYGVIQGFAAGRDVEFGVRPEHIRINAGNESHLSEAFDGVVDIVEPMGSDSLVWINAGGQMLSARVESSARFSPGDKVTVRFRVGLSSLFDAASGDRL